MVGLTGCSVQNAMGGKSDSTSLHNEIVNIRVLYRAWNWYSAVSPQSFLCLLDSLQTRHRLVVNTCDYYFRVYCIYRGLPSQNIPLGFARRHGEDLNKDDDEEVLSSGVQFHEADNDSGHGTHNIREDRRLG